MNEPNSGIDIELTQDSCSQLRSAPEDGQPPAQIEEDSTTQNQAQIAMAVTDANCTQSTDLAGIYFAVQASYEQQIVNANQQALGAVVQQYRADYQKEVSKLPALLKTATAQPFSKPNERG